MPRLVNDSTDNILTYRIIGAAMNVHNSLGPGYAEEIYENALCSELHDQEIPVENQYPVPILHAGEQVGLFYLDLFVDNQVVVEVKAFSHLLTDDELGQMINYLKATGAGVGLLFNFGRRSLDYRRIFPGPKIGTVRRVGRDSIDRWGRR